jgi:hypothetical protein
VASRAGSAGRSSDLEAHTSTEALRVHHAELAGNAGFARADDIIQIADEPDHDELCLREQEFFVKAIRGEVDLASHWQSAIDSLRIVLAADQSFREGRTVRL